MAVEKMLKWSSQKMRCSMHSMLVLNRRAHEIHQYTVRPSDILPSVESGYVECDERKKFGFFSFLVHIKRNQSLMVRGKCVINFVLSNCFFFLFFSNLTHYDYTKKKKRRGIGRVNLTNKI